MGTRVTQLILMKEGFEPRAQTLTYHGLWTPRFSDFQALSLHSLFKIENGTRARRGSPCLQIT